MPENSIVVIRAGDACRDGAAQDTDEFGHSVQDFRLAQTAAGRLISEGVAPQWGVVPRVVVHHLLAGGERNPSDPSRHYGQHGSEALSFADESRTPKFTENFVGKRLLRLDLNESAAPEFV